jgi:hypothetical protein
MSFIIEVYWTNGEFEKYAFIDDTWDGAISQAHTFVKRLNRGKYKLCQETSAILIEK